MGSEGTLACSVFEPSAKKIVESFNIRAAEIEEFSKLLVNFKNLNSYSNKEFPIFKDRNQVEALVAFYLNGLMNSSKDNEFTLDFKQINKAGIFPDWIGLEGGIFTYWHGSDARRKLTIRGSVGNKAGYMSSSAIISITGDTGEDLGYYTYNTEIHLDGRYKSISADSTAKIYKKRFGEYREVNKSNSPKASVPEENRVVRYFN